MVVSRRVHCAIAADRYISNVGYGRVRRIRGFPIQRGGLTATGLRLRRGELRGNWRDRHHCAGHTCIEPRLWPKSQSLAKVFGLDFSIAG